MSLAREFKQFLMRGNLVELAVAFVMGVVFSALLKAFIGDLITPIIALIFGQPNFESLSFTINSSHFHYGDFLNALVEFVIIAAAIYYLVVMPTNRITSLATRNKDATERQCPECLSMIPVGARRCMYCTATVTPANIAPPSPPATNDPRSHRHRPSS